MFPLSFGQQRLWFVYRLEGKNAAYNVSVAFRLKQRFDLDILKQSLDHLQHRHETLRTTFKMDGSTPVQVIHEPSEMPYYLAVKDVSGTPEKDRETEVKRLIDEEVQRPFDLSEESLFRITIFQLDPGSFVMLVHMHHIVSDGWALGILVRELITLYDAFSRNQPSPLPRLPIQYVDFAHWQRQRLTGDLLDKQLQYWKDQLTGAPPLLELPTDFPRPDVFRTFGDNLPVFLPAEPRIKSSC